MRAKPFILILSFSVLATQAMAFYSLVPETYAQTFYAWNPGTINGTTALAPGASTTWQSTDTVNDETGKQNSDGLPIPWKPGFDPKRDIVNTLTFKNTSSMPVTISWSLVASTGYNRFTGESTGNLYGRFRTNWMYNVVLTPD